MRRKVDNLYSVILMISMFKSHFYECKKKFNNKLQKSLFKYEREKNRFYRD